MGAKHSQQAMMPQQPTTHPLFASCTAKKFSDCEYMYKLVIVGATATGRTCCLRRFSGIETFSETVFTVGVDYRVRYITLNDVRISLHMWEVNGVMIAADMRSLFYRGAHGVLVVYDTTHLETFNNMQYWMDEIKQNCHPEAVVMLVGNKCDLTKYKEVDYETAKDFADEHNITFFEVSAKDGTNIELAMMSLVTQIRQKHCELEPNC